MEDSHFFEHQTGLTPNINGLVAPMSSMQTPGPAHKKWTSYKLLLDPQIKKGQQKLYRYDGVVPGPLGADFSVKLIRDPRSRVTRLWKTREKLDLPVPKFKYDKYYIGELPPKQITFTNLNDNVREPFLREMCGKYGTIEEVTIYRHPKTGKHLGLAYVGFSSTRSAKNAVIQLNRTSVMGNIIIVQIDAGGKEVERIYECLSSGKVNTPSSISTTPRDPRHSGSFPNTPDVSTPRMDPRRASMEGRSSSQDAFAFQDPQTPGGIPPPPPPQYAGPPMDNPATPGLSGSFHGMKVHDAQQMPYGNFGQPMLDQYGHAQFQQGGMNPPPHQGNYGAADNPDGYHDPNHGWEQGYHQGHHGGAFGHQRGDAAAADPRQGYGGNQMQPPNAPQQWDQTHQGGGGSSSQVAPQETRTQSSHRDSTPSSHRDSRYGSHRGGRTRTDSKSDGDYHSSRSHHSQRDRYRERKDSFKDRHKSRHSSSLTRDSSRESTRSDRSQSPPPPAPPPPPPQKEMAKPASKEPKKDKKEDDGSTSLDLRIEQLLNQSKMSFSFDLESSQNSGTSGRRDSIGSETKEEPQKEIPGADLYEEFSDEDFEVEQELDDSENREDKRDSWSSRSNNYDRSERYSDGSRGNRDNSRGRHRDYSPDRSRDRYDDNYRDRHRDRDQGRHKKSHKHKGRDDRHRSSDRQRGYSKHSRDDSDDDNDDNGSRGKYSDRGRDGFSRRGRSSLDREDSLDPYRSNKLDQDETSQDVPRKRNSRDQTPIGDDEDIQIMDGHASAISKNIAILRQGGKGSPFGVSSPAMEVSITGTDSQGSTPLTAEPSTSALLTPRLDSSQVDVPPPPPPRHQEPPVPPSQQGQWPTQTPKPNENHAQLQSLAKAAAAYAQSKLAMKNSGATTAATNLNIPQAPGGNLNIPVSGAYGATGALQPGVYGTPAHGVPQQQATSPNAAYPWMGATSVGGSPYGQHLQQHSMYHMQMITRMGLWQQFNANPSPNSTHLQQGQWPMQTQPGMTPGMSPASQQWMANYQNMAQGPNQSWTSPPGFPNQQFAMNPYGNYPQNQHNFVSPPKRDPVEDLTEDILETLVLELKVIMKKDLHRKMVESSAFKSLENWWDDCERRAKEPVKTEEDVEIELKKEIAAKTPEKKRPVLPHIPSLLDSSSWVKSFSENKSSAMEGMGLGLGFRAQMPKMPSFKRHRKPLLPTPKKEVKGEKKRDEDLSDTEKDRREKDEESSQASEPEEAEETTRDRKKKWAAIYSSSDDEDEDDDEDDDEDFEDEDEEDEEEEEEEEEEVEVEEEAEQDAEQDEEDVDVEIEVEIEKDEEEEEMQVDVADKEDKKKEETEKKKDEDSEEESDWSDSEDSSGSSASSSEESESEEEGEEGTATKKEAAAVGKDGKIKDKVSSKDGEEEDIDVEDESEDSDAAVNGDAERKALERISEEDEKKEESLEESDKAASSKKKEPITKDADKSDKSAFELLVELATKAQPESLAEKTAAEKAKLSEEAAIPSTQDKDELEAAELLQSMKNAKARVTLKKMSSIDGLPTPERTEPSEKAATPKASKRPQVRIPSAAESLRRRLAASLPDLKYLADLMSVDEKEEPELVDVGPVELSIVEEEVVGMAVEGMMEEAGYDQAVEPQESGALQKITFLEDHSYCQRPPQSPPKPVRLDEGFPLPAIAAELPREEAAGTGAAESVSSTTLTADSVPTEDEASSRKRKLSELEPAAEPTIPEPDKPLFEPRNYYEEWSTLYKFLSEGIDHEDSYFLRKSYENLLEDSGIPWLNYSHWVPHAITNIPNPKKKRKRNIEDELNVHASGGARTEGYYKISIKEKMKYLTKVDRLEDYGRQNQMLSTAKHSMELSREARSDQRRVIAALQAQEGSTGSDLLRFNQLKFRKKELKFNKSGIHGWGLYAMENIAADEMVIEYVGQSVRQALADEREIIYGKKGIGSSYLFRIDAQQIIDATKCGNLARFINHSCNPNCYAKIITVESVKKIVIYSKEAIGCGEEITYDYKFPIEDEKIVCLCGAPTCRGTLN